jgi:hypothetical protein
MIRSLVLATTSLSLLLSLACGGVRHASRPDLFPDAKDPSLVEVRTTGFDGPTRTVSYSTWDVDPNEELPAEAPAGVVEDMREEAANYGADMLLIERVEDDWRKVWLGLGVKKDELAPKEIPVCGQAGFDAAQEDAKRRAANCAQLILSERPQLRGLVSVVFEVDPEGRALRAAPTPDSSRDSEFQECVVGAVHTTTYGEPKGFSCQGRVTVEIAGGAGSQ